MGSASVPGFSVIICTYNRADRLPRSIGSVLAQTFADFEIVVVDDGSTDETRRVVSSARDPRVQYVHRENGGISRARNTGVERARGRYVVFLDDDDEALPEWLERLDAALDGGRVAAVSCGMVVERPGEMFALLPKPMGPVFDDRVGLFRSGSFAVRRDAYLEAGGFAEDLQCSHQTEFALRLLPLCTARGWPVRAVQEPLVRWNQEAPEQRTEAAPEKLLSGTKYVLAKHRERLARSRPLLANHYSIAGVAAARTGDYAEARRLLARAVRAEPGALRRYARLLCAVFPPLARKVWRSASFGRGPVSEGEGLN